MSNDSSLQLPDDLQPLGFKSLSSTDWLWAGLWIIAGGLSLNQYNGFMDGYEVSILIFSVFSLVGLGWYWKPVRLFSVSIFLLSLVSLWFYGEDLKNADSQFFLKYILSSQAAITWMSALYFMATAAYLLSLITKSDWIAKLGSQLTWIATAMGFIGLLVRWKESYLVHPDFGHIPVSNLYEVFVLFCIITALIYLYYEDQTKRHFMGFFALLVISAAVGFSLWYASSRDAADIQPLVPALQSYWMKIHVPANFVGYGAFSLAAMLAVAQLFVIKIKSKNPSSWFVEQFPGDVLEDIIYKSIALGFAFFTIATVLGALWAAEAWGGYWSWDPKETWALIVWLNYAAWLHMRLTKGWRGVSMAWWAVIGFFITLFAFLGVNMFLSGLHSYGEL